MKKGFILLTIFAAVLFNSFPDYAKGDVKSITVMSYNIRNSSANDGTNSWEYRYPATAMMILDQYPDVIGMQEVLPDQEEYLKDVLEDYKGVGVPREDGKRNGEIMFLMFNGKTQRLVKWGTFWLSETPEKPSKGWDADCYRTATWALLQDKRSGNRYFFIDTHLDHIGTEARKNGLQLIVDKIGQINPNSYPMIIVGDFNMKISDPSMTPMKTAMKDARTTAVMTDESHTYHGWGKEKKQIDFIWYNGFSSCTKFETVTKSYYDRKFISDHYPVKSVLVF